MKQLTKRQREVLEFILEFQNHYSVAPTLREIAAHFGFQSMTAAADHVRALRRKNYLTHQPRRARAHGLITPFRSRRATIMDIPIRSGVDFPAAPARPEADRCVSMDAATLGLSPAADAFALEVQDDAMVQREIRAGDLAIFERNRAPRSGDIVAAMCGNEVVLQNYAVEKGKPGRLREPRREESLVQGVLVAVIRRTK
jgi:repressor LexA